MISDIMDSKETVKVLDFLIFDPLSAYNKTEIASGSAVSRPVVQRIADQLLKLGVLKVAKAFGNTELYELDLKSPLVISLMRFSAELSKALVDAEMDCLDTALVLEYDSECMIHETMNDATSIQLINTLSGQPHACAA